MIRVAALTSGRNVPSARFRVRQHIGPLREEGILVREYVPAVDKYAPVPGWLAGLTRYGFPDFLVEHGWRGAKRAARVPGILGSRRSDVTWLERMLLPGFLTAEGKLGRPLLFDVDDAVWLSPPGGRSAVAAVASMADVVVAGNGYLADRLSACARRVRIVPTAIDTERFSPRADRGGASRETFVVGWTGTSSNFPYLERIEPVLGRFLADHETARLLVVADRPYAFRAIPPEKARYVPWSPQVEVDAVREMDVGIMPLADDEWTRGKCSFKALQYMACAVPAVLSPVGMNREILGEGGAALSASGEDEWYGILSHLMRERGAAAEQGRRGRALAESRYSVKAVSKTLAGIIRELV